MQTNSSFSSALLRRTLDANKRLFYPGRCTGRGHLALLLLLAVAMYVGCTPSETPVERISLQDSGVPIVAVSTATTSSDWANWRGPTADGVVSNAAGLKTNWTEEDYKWTADVPGRGHSSPVIAGDKIFMGSAIVDADQQVLLAYDRNNGELLWQSVIHDGGIPTDKRMHPKATFADPTPVVTADSVYITFFNGDSIFITAVNFEGKIRWQKNLGQFQSVFGYAQSPLVYKSTVIATVDTNAGGSITALDAETGEIAWRQKRERINAFSNPTLATIGDSTQLILPGGDAVASYDPETGEQNWKTSCLAATTCGTAIIHNNRIYAGGGYPKNGTVCLDAQGNVIWKNGVRVYEPSLAASNGLIFAANDQGIGFCWDAATGDQKWKKRLGGGFSSSPIIANGLVYVANLNGECLVFNASGESYEQIANNKIGSDCYASPAVVNGELFFRVGVQNDAKRTEKLICVSAE